MLEELHLMRVAEAVDELGGQVTPPEVAMKVGVKIELAQAILLALSSSCQGKVQVHGRGQGKEVELLFLFPANVQGLLRRSSVLQRVLSGWRAAKTVLYSLFRVTFGVSLLLVILIVIVAVIVIIVAWLSQQKERGGDNSMPTSGFWSGGGGGPGGGGGGDSRWFDEVNGGGFDYHHDFRQHYHHHHHNTVGLWDYLLIREVMYMFLRYRMAEQARGEYWELENYPYPAGCRSYESPGYRPEGEAGGPPEDPSARQPVSPSAPNPLRRRSPEDVEDPQLLSPSAPQHPPLSFPSAVFSFVFGEVSNDEEIRSKRWAIIAASVFAKGCWVADEELRPYDLRAEGLRGQGAEEMRGQEAEGLRGQEAGGLSGSESERLRGQESQGLQIHRETREAMAFFNARVEADDAGELAALFFPIPQPFAVPVKEYFEEEPSVFSYANPLQQKIVIGLSALNLLLNLLIVPLALSLADKVSSGGRAPKAAQAALALASGTLKSCRWLFLCYALLFVAIPPLRLYLLKLSNDSKATRNSLRKAAAQRLYPQVLDPKVKEKVDFSRRCSQRFAQQLEGRGAEGLSGSAAMYETVTKDQKEEIRLFLKTIQSRDL